MGMLKNLVTLAIFHSNIEASNAARQLQNAGIEAEVLSGTGGRVGYQLPYPRNNAQAIQVRVPKEDYLKARSILKK